MKKSLILLLLVLMLAIPPLGTASAQNDKINIKGEVLSFDGGILTVESNKGEMIEVILPEGLDLPGLEVGDAVLIKATAGENGEWIARTVKVLGQGDDDLNEMGSFEDNSAYCSEDKKDTPHPLAIKIAERYDVSEEMVMTYYCQGYSIGQIMLAIKTSQLEGVEVSPETILDNLESGIAWGLIWKDMGLIGWEKNGNSPPGQLKKPDKFNSDGDD
jgi:hypothetical protein